MKTKRFIPVVLVSAMVFSFGSCTKEHTPAPGNEGTVDKVEDLSVPAGFDWKTSMDVRCNFSAPHSALVHVSKSENGTPFATFLAGEGADMVTLNIPTATRTIYVQYETENGLSAAEALPVTGTTLSYEVPADARPYTEPAALQARGETGIDAPYASQDDKLINIPADGWGTLMFEDLWPSYGDYDFNDLVAGYKIQLYLQNKNKVREMLIGLNVRAVGGSLPYDLYLAMTGVKGGEIDDIEMIQNENGAATVEMVQLNPGNPEKDPALFLFRDVKTNAKKPGGAYLNTVAGSEMAESDLVTVTFHVTFRNSIAIEDITFDKFDFFIARPESGQNPAKEIHRGGFAPLLYGTATYETVKASSPVTEGVSDYYYSKSNLVWALNIPAAIPHAYESVDFTKAYPNFAAWAQSGGQEHKDWYENTPGNRVSSNLVKTK